VLCNHIQERKIGVLLTPRFSTDDAISTENFHQYKGYNPTKLIREFPVKSFQYKKIFNQKRIVSTECHVYKKTTTTTTAAATTTTTTTTKY